MNTTIDNVRAFVHRYEEEKGEMFSVQKIAEFTQFADWLLQQNFCKPDVSGCKELEAQKPNKGITFKITKYDPEIFIDDVGDVE